MLLWKLDDYNCNCRRYAMSEYSDDDYNQSSDDCTTDLGGFVTKQIDKSEISKGKIAIFGKTINVGPGGSEALRSAVQTIQDNIAFEGAKYARRYSISFAKALKVQDHHAEKIGNLVDFGWRFGLPVTNFLLGVRTSIAQGHAEMCRLAQDASVVLTANNKNGVGGMLSLSNGFSALTYERTRVFENGKKNILANIGGLVSSLPGVLINYWSWQRDLINDSNRPIRELRKNATPEERRIAEEKRNRLVALKSSADAGTSAEQTDMIARFTSPKSLADYDRNINQSRIVGPIIGGLLGQIVTGDIEKKSQTDSAWQRIKDLKARMMSEEPKESADIEDAVRSVFIQHARDMKMRAKLSGRRFDNIVEAVAKSLVNDNLHPEALVELLDNKQVIDFNRSGVTYGNAAHINHVLSSLIEKYTAKIDMKEFYQNATFTPKDAVAAFSALTDEEKPFYVMLFPTGILENAGANKADLEKYREIGKRYFIDEVTTALENMLKAGTEELKKRGVNNELVDELEDIRKDFMDAVEKGRPNQYVMEHRDDVNELVRKIVLTSKKPDELWQDYIKTHKEESKAEPSTMAEKYTSGGQQDSQETQNGAGTSKALL